jgi:photosystem II stability/assembly factor-like uncharacterized protein
MARYVCCALLILLLPGVALHANLMPVETPKLKARQSLLLDTAVAGKRLVAVGERGHIIYSDNDGKQWQQARVPTTQLLTAVYFLSAQQGWAVGHDGLILVSHDGATSWQVQRDGLQAQQAINRQNQLEAQQRVEQLKRELASTQDTGSAELEEQLGDAIADLEDADTALAEPVFTAPLMDIWFSDRLHGWAVGAFGTLLQTTNGGSDWRDVHERVANPDGLHYYGVTGNTDGRMLIAGEAGSLYRSLDAGQTWEQLQSPYDGSWFGVVNNTAADRQIIFGLRGNIFYTSDFGNHWTPANSENTLTLAGGTAAPDGTVVLVGSVGAILHSADGGKNFITQMQDNRLSLSSVLIDEQGNYFVAGQGGIQAIELVTQEQEL